MKENIKFIALLVLVLVVVGLQVKSQLSFKQDVEAIAKSVIEQNGEMIVASVKKSQESKQEELKKQAVQNLGKYQKQIFASNMVIGNPQGSVKIIEFFDYNCGYCKKFHNNLSQFLKTDSDVAVYLMEFPILGEPSMKASQIAVAAHMLDASKYEKLHNEFLEFKGRITEDTALKIASKTGYKKSEIKAKAASKEVADLIAMNRQIAQELFVNSTPTVVVGDEILPGAISVEELKMRVNFVRENAS